MTTSVVELECYTARGRPQGGTWNFKFPPPLSLADCAGCSFRIDRSGRALRELDYAYFGDGCGGRLPAGDECDLEHQSGGGDGISRRVVASADRAGAERAEKAGAGRAEKRDHQA